MLGSYPTNSRQIEPQIMKKFIQQQQVQSVQMPQECSSLSQALLNDSRWTRSLLQSVSVSSMCALQVQNLAQCDTGTCDYQIFTQATIDVIPPIKQYVLTCDEIENLKEMYKMLYQKLHFQRVCCKVQKVCVCGEMITSAKGNTYGIEMQQLSIPLFSISSPLLLYNRICICIFHSTLHSVPALRFPSWNTYYNSMCVEWKTAFPLHT